MPSTTERSYLYTAVSEKVVLKKRKAYATIYKGMLGRGRPGVYSVSARCRDEGDDVNVSLRVLKEHNKKRLYVVPNSAPEASLLLLYR